MMGQEQLVEHVSSNLGPYFLNVGIIGTATYALAEGIGRLVKRMKRFENAKWVKLALAVAFGTLGGLAAEGAGFLQAPTPGFWSKVFAVIMGLGGTALAMLTNAGVDVVRSKFGK